jgi:phage terminase small subunit
MPNKKLAANRTASNQADDGVFPFDIPEAILNRPIIEKAEPAKCLPPHLERFCQELLLPGQSARQAALKAGAREATAHATAAYWKKREDVQNRLRQIYHYQALRAAANADRVLAELARVAFGDPRRFLTDDDGLKPASEWTADDAAAVKELEVDEIKMPDGEGGMVVVGHKKKLKLHDKLGALRILAAHHRLMDEAAGPKVTMNVNIQL